MKLIKPYTEILTPINGEEILKTIEKIARTCYKSEEKITKDSAIILVKNLIVNGHEAMIEFFDITVKFVCDRGISHEIVRHRIASFAQESTRYVNYSKGIYKGNLTYILPNWITIHSVDHASRIWKRQVELSEKAYLALIELGWSPQQARSVLPNSLKTEINVKMNLREWRHFFKLRCSPKAHPQMGELTIPLLKEFQSKIPIIFDDIKSE